jgi:predicted ATP-dependent endonuclease of OLD family
MMAIQSASLENFTGFEKLDINFSGGINVFVGENGTGKTHLLKVLYAFCESDSDKAFVEKLYDCMPSSDAFDSIRHTASGTQVSDDQGITIISEEKTCHITQKPLNMQFILENAANEKCLNEHSYDTAKKTKLPAAFIPAKEMLTHAGLEKDFLERRLPLDDTLIDILNKCGVSTLRELSKRDLDIITAIKGIIGGEVEYADNKYYINRGQNSVGFSKESEGFKKFACIYRLIETGLFRKGSILFWDEPEANINPKNIPALVDILFTLQRSGVQIFLATHNYFISKYLNMRKEKDHDIIFHSLYKENNSVKCESESDFEQLDNNLIIEQSINLYQEEVDRVMG